MSRHTIKPVHVYEIPVEGQSPLRVHSENGDVVLEQEIDGGVFEEIRLNPAAWRALCALRDEVRPPRRRARKPVEEVS